MKQVWRRVKVVKMWYIRMVLTLILGSITIYVLDLHRSFDIFVTSAIAYLILYHFMLSDESICNLFNLLIDKIPTQPKIEEAYNINNDILHVTMSDGTIHRYKGSGTVWNHYPTMVRCDTSLEGSLCDIWQYLEEHGSPYPTAHKEKLRNENIK